MPKNCTNLPFLVKNYRFFKLWATTPLVQCILLLNITQPLRLLSGKRESSARPAQEHKICAIVANLEAQGWRKLAPDGAGVAQTCAGRRRGDTNSNFDFFFVHYAKVSDIINKLGLNLNLNYSEYFFFLFWGGKYSCFKVF